MKNSPQIKREVAQLWVLSDFTYELAKASGERSRAGGKADFFSAHLFQSLAVGWPKFKPKSVEIFVTKRLQAKHEVWSYNTQCNHILSWIEFRAARARARHEKTKRSGMKGGVA